MITKQEQHPEVLNPATCQEDHTTLNETPEARRSQFWMVALLLAFGVLAGGVWGFLELADEVREGSTYAFDEAVLLLMRTAEDLNDPLGPLWLEEMVRDFTAMGGVGVLSILTLAVVGYLLLTRNFRTALVVLLTIAIGLLISSFLKAGFDRPRPDLVAYGSYVSTSSFPSGHSMMSAIVYLTLGLMLASIQALARLKVYLVTIALLLTTLIGISRVYLGVHWPTDVFAGWLAGAVWAVGAWLLGNWLAQRQRPA